MRRASGRRGLCAGTSRKLACAATVGWTLFIWSRSLFAGPESLAQSDAVVNLVRPLLVGFGVHDANAMSFLVRKAGHVSEYLVLGLLATLACKTLSGRTAEDRGVSQGLAGLAFGLAVAVIDESIQRFVPGRSGQAADVLIDAAGLIAGSLLVSLIVRRMARRG